MSARAWIEVELPVTGKGDPIVLPAERCANCGTRQTLPAGATLELRNPMYGVVSGWERTVRVRAGTCGPCAPTMTKAPPGVGDGILLAIALLVVVLAGAGVAIGWFVGVEPLVIGAGVISIIAPIAWFRRRPRPPRTSNYHPIRVRGVVAKVRAGDGPGVRLAFSNDAYAALAASAAGAIAIPAARVVKMARRADDRPVADLPETAPSPCVAARVRLLAAIADAPEPQGSRRASRGIHLAEQVVREVPLDDDPRRWIADVLAALAKLRADTDDDDDGWVYGGIATVRRAAEDLRDAL